MKINLNNLNKVYKAKQSSVETMELKGYELVKELFADMSGFGQDDETALTANQFNKEVKELVTKHGELTAKITDVGQFQCFVGLFKKIGKSKSRIIGNNTLKIQYDDCKAIRLHNTNILTFKDKKVIFDTGGWNTRTTSDRMNKYAPEGMYIHRKNWEMLVDYKDKTHEFVDNRVSIRI